MQSVALLCGYALLCAKYMTAQAMAEAQGPKESREAKAWYTVDEAAAYLGVSRRTIYQMTKEERLQAYLLGKQRVRRFKRSDLDSAPRKLYATGKVEGTDAFLALTSGADPVLAELWDNERDAAYDKL